MKNSPKTQVPGPKAAVIILVLLLAVSAACAAGSAEEYILQGHGYYKAQKYGKAVEMYKKALGLDPANETALKYCGYAYTKAGDYGTALIYLKELYAITLDPKIKKTIDAIEYEGEGKDEEKGKIYRNLVSVNVIPYAALFFNASYELAIGNSFALRAGVYTWSLVPDFAGIFVQAHFYPQGRGLAGWSFGGGVGTLQAKILPNIRGGYRWIFNSGFSMDVMLGTILIQSLTHQAIGGIGSMWPSVEYSLGYAF
jgi:hypothetical protein